MTLWAAATVVTAGLLHPFDVHEYEVYARAALHLPPLHHLPVEYPAPALILFVLPLVVPVGYAVSFALEMGLVLAALVGRFGPPQGEAAEDDPAMRLVAYLAAGAVVVLTGRFDIAAAAAVFWAVRAGRQGRFGPAWAWACAGALIKLFPVVLWPVLLAAETRARGRLPVRRLWWPLATVAGVAVVPLVADRAALLDNVRYYLHRPVEIGSIPAGLSLLADWSATRWVDAAHSAGIENAWASPLALGVGLVAVAACLRVWWLLARGEVDLFAAALASVTCVVLGTKVVSVQYLLWLMPLWACLPMRRSWLAGAALGTLVFPAASLVLAVHPAGNRPLGVLLTLTFLARDGLVAAGTWSWWRTVRGRGAVPAALGAAL